MTSEAEKAIGRYRITIINLRNKTIYKRAGGSSLALRVVVAGGAVEKEARAHSPYLCLGPFAIARHRHSATGVEW